jgi:hypothetical protein
LGKQIFIVIGKLGEIIYCIGDSHVSFFSGSDRIIPLSPDNKQSKYPIFKPYRLGASLAYNCFKYNTKTQSREKLDFLLKKVIEPKSRILLSFGEIDCRVHLVLQAEKKNVSIDKVVEECIEQYMRLVDYLISRKYTVILWNVVPTTICPDQNKNYPSNGTLEQRTQATIVFNKMLEKEANIRRIDFWSIFNQITDNSGIMISKYFYDCVHLSNIAMPLVLSKENIGLRYLIKSVYNIKIESMSKMKSRLWGKIKLIKNKLTKDKLSRKYNRLFSTGFHGDKYLLEFMFKLLIKADLFIETGSQEGHSICHVTREFPELKCYSCEGDRKAYLIAKKNLKLQNSNNVRLIHTLSPQFLYDLYVENPNITDSNAVFWLDAHGFGFEWPLRDELKHILDNYKNCYIIIDDFKVPDRPQFGYDSYNNQECSLEYVGDILSSHKDIEIYFPNYSEVTSDYNPLRGWVCIQVGNSKSMISDLAFIDRYK